MRELWINTLSINNENIDSLRNLIDPEAEDYPGSKVNAAVERIYKIWLNTAEDRETIRKRMSAFSKNIIRSIREISPEAFQRIMGSRQLTGNH